MGNSPLLCTTPKIKSIVTAACNQLGDSSSTAYKIYMCCKKVMDLMLGLIMTPARETSILDGCPLISTAFRRP